MSGTEVERGRQGRQEEGREGYSEASDLEDEHFLRRNEELNFGPVNPDMPQHHLDDPMLRNVYFLVYYLNFSRLQFLHL